MRIAMMVRSFLETPVPNDISYSPSIVAQHVAEGLHKKGHEVTFFGPSGTKLDVKEVKNASMQSLARTQSELNDLLSETDLFERYRTGLYDNYMAREMLEAAKKGEYDAVMFNHFESVASLAGLYPEVPVVYILHDFMGDHQREILERFESDNQYFISISNNQRRSAPDLNYVDTVYNGIDTDQFLPDGKPESYLVASGRITPDKGIKEAVQVAIQTGRRLIIAGPVLPADRGYFDEHIKPYLNEKILYLGQLDRDLLAKYYQKATALLFPIQWQEPFGLAMAEAASCGTPTIAFNRGSVPEVLKDGETGFIVNNSAEMISAIDRIDSIKRSDCRNHIVKNFSVSHMVDGYEKVLNRIINQHGKPTTTPHTGSKNFSSRLRKISRRLLDA